MPMVRLPLTVEHALLGLLRERSMYGYEIHQQLTAAHDLGLVWTVKQSMLYALLARLEAEGLVASALEPQAARPARKILQLTPAGAVAFQQWVEAPVPHGRDLRVEFLAKLYFARQQGSAAAHALVGRQRAALHERLADLQQNAEQSADPQSYDWLVLRFRIGQLAATLSWLELCATWLDTAASPS